MRALSLGIHPPTASAVTVIPGRPLAAAGLTGVYACRHGVCSACQAKKEDIVQLEDEGLSKCREGFFRDHPAARPLLEQIAARDLVIDAMAKVGHAQTERARKALDDHVNDLMRQKYYCARRIWPIRHKRTPSDDCTWEAWFQWLFSEPLEDYVKRAAEQNIRQHVIEQETAAFGWSPLAREKAA